MSGIIKADPQEKPGTFAIQGLRAAFGQGSPREMMVASVVLATIAYVSALFSAGATLVFVALFTLTFLVGLARLLYAAIRS